MRRRMRPRRLRRKGQWLNGMSGNTCSVALSRNVCDVDPSTFTTDLFLLVDNPIQSPEGSVSTVGEATVVRIVGEIDITVALAGTPTASWWMNMQIAMGIYIVDQDVAGNVLVRSPTRDVENGDWLWKGTYWFSDCGQAGAVFHCSENDLASEGTNANGSHIDLRVKRKIKREESIVLAVEMVEDVIIGNGTQPVPAGNINGNVRAYVLEP
jgi:hypothetical protein